MQMVLLVVRRYRRQKTRFIALIFGFGVAGILLSGMAIYSETMRAAALTYELGQLEDKEPHLVIRVPTGRATIGTFERLNRRISSMLQEASSFTGQVTPFTRSATFYLKLRDDVPLPPEDIRPRSFFLSLGDLEERFEVIKGDLPAPIEFDENKTAAPMIIPVLIGEESAADFGIDVGSNLTLVPYWDDQFDQVIVSVVGIGKALDHQDPFGREGLSPETDHESSYKTLPLVIAKETLFRGVGKYFPNISYDFSWLIPVQQNRLTPVNAEEAATVFHSLRKELLQLPEQPVLHTQIINALETYATRLFFTGVPLTLLVTQVEGIALLYLVILGFFLVERQRTELTLLRSRGASTFQLLMPFIIEGLILVALTVVVAPLISAALVALVGVTSWLEPLSAGGLLPVKLTGKAFLLAGLGSGLGLVILLIPALLAGFSTGVQLPQSGRRSQRSPFFLRYKLDILLMAALVIIGWEVSERGSLVRFTLAGQAVVNPILYALPSLLVLTAGMMFLRVFPLVTSIAAKMLEPRGPTWLLMGLWHLSRGPGTGGALVLLLALTTGTTLFAASFGPTLERNAYERIQYQIGAPLRLEGIHLPSTGESFNLQNRLESIEGIQVVSPIYRGQGTDRSSLWGESYKILAVDPSTFQKVGWYRDDFSQPAIDDLLARLDEGEIIQGGLDLPLETSHLGLWVRPGKSERGLNLFARIRDANGRIVDYRLSRLDFADWRYLEVPMDSSTVWPNTEPFEPLAPLTLQGLFVQATRWNRNTGPGSVYFDDLQVREADGIQPRILDSFEEPGRWGVLQDSLERSPDSFDYTVNSALNGERGGAFSWGSTSQLSIQGITPVAHGESLSAIASASFLSESGRTIGDRLIISAAGHVVPIIIIGQVDFFPTLNPYKEGFLILNFQRLKDHANLLAPSGGALPNELWLTTDSNTDVPELARALREIDVNPVRILNLQEQLTSAQVDPFVLGGWSGWLIIVFLAASIVSIAGFVTYAVFNLEQRQASVAVMESLGMNARQVLAIVASELLFLLIAGGLLGAVLGTWLGSILLPFLDVTGTGEAAVPPLVVVRTWGGVFLVYGGMALVFGVLLVFIVRWFSGLALTRVLKQEEI
jgi:hypothetical protein